MSEPRLDPPLRDVLDAELDEADIPRLWRGVEARRARARSPRRWLKPALAAAAVIALIAGGGVAWSELFQDEAGPLAFADGTRADGPLEPSARVAFADGSWIETGQRAELSILQSSSQALVTHLRAGRVEVEVEPGGPRRWVVEAGATTVEVVGTRFAVERNDDRVRVSVSRGAVLVRHPDLDDGLRRLGPGERVVVGRAPIAARPRVAPRARRTNLPAPISSPALAEAAEPELAPAEDPEGSEAGDPAVAVAADPPAEALMRQADAAREAGRPESAVAPLEQLLREHPRHPSAAFAAFTLGQVELDHLERPAAAARHFERALGAGLSGALAADARARLAIARERIGDHGGARDAAEAYLQDRPDGPRAAAMQRILERR